MFIKNWFLNQSELVHLKKMVHSPTPNDATAAFPNSKYSFFLRNYDRAGDWLRKNGFRGLRPVPNEFQMQTASLSHRPTSNTTLQADQLRAPPVASLEEKIVEAPLNELSTETANVKKVNNIRLQEIPPPSLSIDEEYLRAAEVNRRHIAERDRFKNNSNSNSSWDSSTRKSQPAKLHSAPTSSPQIQYVDYCKMETYVTRSVAPSPLNQSHNASNGASSVKPSSATNFKHNSKSRKNNKGMSFTSSSWHKKLHEQTKSKLGPGGTDYDRFYGGGAKAASVIKARETELQVNFDRFSDRHQPKLWPQLPVQLNFNNQ